MRFNNTMRKMESKNEVKYNEGRRKIKQVNGIILKFMRGKK